MIANVVDCVMLQDNLADVQAEINIKERLIFELERSEKRLAELRSTYEKKLAELSLRIKQTEAERDKNINESPAKTSDKGGDDKARVSVMEDKNDDDEMSVAKNAR